MTTKILLMAFLPAVLQLGLTAQAQERDTDGDGVPDAQDICPSTPKGATPMAEGCSAMELVQHRDIFVRPLTTSLDEVLAGLGDDIETARAAQTAREARDLILTMADQLGAGQVCEAAGTQSTANARLQLAEGLISGIADTRREMVFGRPTGDAGEIDKDKLKAAHMRLWQAELRRMAAKAVAWERQIQGLCSSVRARLAVRAKLVAKDENARRITLANGQTYALAEVAFSHPLFEGQTINAGGLLFTDNTGIITSYTSSEPHSQPTSVAKCIEFRIAPVQRPPSFFPRSIYVARRSCLSWRAGHPAAGRRHARGRGEARVSDLAVFLQSEDRRHGSEEDNDDRNRPTRR